jgi:hypothetical protein
MRAVGACDLWFVNDDCPIGTQSSSRHVHKGMRYVHSNSRGYRGTSSLFLLHGTPGGILPDNAPKVVSYVLAAFTIAGAMTW